MAQIERRSSFTVQEFQTAYYIDALEIFAKNTKIFRLEVYFKKPFIVGLMAFYLQSCLFEIEPGPRYEVNLRVFAIAYHSLKMQLHS